MQNVITVATMRDSDAHTIAEYTPSRELMHRAALGVYQAADWTGKTGTNISGTTDLAPLDGQADMLKELFPDAKNVGLLYCSAEPNSKYQIDTIKPLLEKLGYTCTEYAFTDSNDVASVTQKAAAASDVMYIPTDNTAASCTEAIANVVIPAKVPVIAGEQGICSQGSCHIKIVGIVRRQVFERCSLCGGGGVGFSGVGFKYGDCLFFECFRLIYWFRLGCLLCGIRCCC
mgnify:CR=1 FL=1